MKLDIKKTGEITRDLSIEVSAPALKDIREKTLEKINNEVSIAGFRKGKAPADLIEKRFSEQVKARIIEDAVPFYYNKAVTENNLEVVSTPQVKKADYQDRTLTFTATVELKPKVDIDSKVYKSIKVKHKPVSVEDKEIKKFSEEMKDKVAKALGKKKEETDTATVYKWAGYLNQEELEKSIASEIYLNKIVQRRKALEKQVTDHLLSKVKFSLPGSILKEQKKRMMDYQVSDLKSRGVPEEEIKKHSGELSQRIEVMAQDQVKLYYILEAIAEKEDLKYDRSNVYEAVMGFILTNVLS
jgi:trigger factor